MIKIKILTVLLHIEIILSLYVIKPMFFNIL